MKDLVSKIYEGFYSNVGSMKEISDKKESIRYNFRWVGIEFSIYTDCKDWWIDTLCDAIIKSGIKLGKPINCSISKGWKDVNIVLYNYLSTEPKYKKFISNSYSSAGESIIFDMPLVLHNKNVFTKLYGLDFIGKILRDVTVKDDIARQRTISLAFSLATMKLNKVIKEDVKFNDLDEQDLNVCCGIADWICADLSEAAIRPPLSDEESRGVIAKEQKVYNDALAKIDTLKADLILLRDNQYPFNAMVERTINDIDSRARVIARLANKYRK